MLKRLLNQELFRKIKCFSEVGPLYTSHFVNLRNMSTTTDDLVVEHDINNKKFFIRLGEVEAKLEYGKEKQKDGKLILDMWHTEVPPQLQGKGIAKILAKEAFEYVVANDLKMHLSCSYLQKYLQDNPLEKYKAVTL